MYCNNNNNNNNTNNNINKQHLAISGLKVPGPHVD